MKKRIGVSKVKWFSDMSLQQQGVPLIYPNFHPADYYEISNSDSLRVF